MKFLEKLEINTNNNECTLIGEILVDIIHKDKMQILMGGSTLNITRNLVNLDIDTKLFGSIGNDRYGKFIYDEMKKESIDSSNITTLKRKTSYVEVHDNDESPIPKFFRSSDYHIYLDKNLKDAISTSKIMHFSYWPLSKEPSKTTIFDAIQIAKSHSVLIGFDPNYHKELVNDDSISRDELLNLFRIVDILKPSLDDTIRLFGKRDSIVEYIEIYEKLGCKLIILTLGSKGIIASYKGERIILKSLATSVVDVTGAGDAFWSGLYKGILQNNNIYNSIQLGLASSALALRVIGGKINFPSIQKIKKEFNI